MLFQELDESQPKPDHKWYEVNFLLFFSDIWCYFCDFRCYMIF